MSDDEDVLYVKKQKTVHYGFLEEERAVVKSGDSDEEVGSLSNTGQQAPEAGNVNISVGIF
jgi:outer membrane lipoprotein SlyB